MKADQSKSGRLSHLKSAMNYNGPVLLKMAFDALVYRKFGGNLEL